MFQFDGYVLALPSGFFPDLNTEARSNADFRTQFIIIFSSLGYNHPPSSEHALAVRCSPYTNNLPGTAPPLPPYGVTPSAASTPAAAIVFNDYYYYYYLLTTTVAARQAI